MNPKNPYETRWRWWYSSIADWMIRNPGGTMQDCATELGRGYTTICLIANTDMFRTYLDERKREWRQHHDFSLVSKMTAIAEGGLDIILEKMQTQRHQIPMKLIHEVTVGALDRLGYSPEKSPTVQVNNFATDNRKQVMVTAPVSPAALEEARDALRLAERRRSLEAPEPSFLLDSHASGGKLGGVGTEAEPYSDLDDEGEELSAPLTLSAQ